MTRNAACSFSSLAAFLEVAAPLLPPTPRSATTDLGSQASPTAAFLLWRDWYLAVSKQEAQETRAGANSNFQQQDSR